MFALPFGSACMVPSRTDRACLAVAAGAILAVSALAIRPAPPAPRIENPAVTLVATGVSLAALDRAAEEARLRLLTLPGVGAVRLQGLLVTGLAVEYAPARLARLGITTDVLRAVLPAMASGSSPGRIALRPDAAEDGPQPIADRLVHAAAGDSRLGDIATVARVKLDPVSTLHSHGLPAVQLDVVPAAGTPAGTLTEAVAGILDGTLPSGVTLK